MWTLLLHVPVLWLHGHSSTLDTVFHLNICYTEHCYFMYMYYRHTDIATHDTIISYSFPLTHGYTIPLDTVISYICTIAHGYSVHSYIMFIHHCYMDSPVYMRWLFLYSCCMDHCSYYIDIHVFPLHDRFPLLILIYCYWTY